MLVAEPHRGPSFIWYSIMLCLGSTLREVQILCRGSASCRLVHKGSAHTGLASGPASDPGVALLSPLYWDVSQGVLVSREGSSPCPEWLFLCMYLLGFFSADLLSSSLTQVHLIHPLSLHSNVTPVGESFLSHRNMHSAASMVFPFLRLVYLNAFLIKHSLARIIYVPF